MSDILTAERDALRKALGDIEYYFKRWEGISPDALEWLNKRIAQMGEEIQAQTLCQSSDHPPVELGGKS